MTHISYEDWLQYVKDDLEAQVRERYEDHLYTCDQCLELYLEAVEAVEMELPAPEHPDELTTLIMEQVHDMQLEQVSAKPTPFYQKTIFHYTIAAAMTILFMTSGVFQSIASVVDEVQSPAIVERTPSITEELMNKTFAWIDSFEMKEREGTNE